MGGQNTILIAALCYQNRPEKGRRRIGARSKTQNPRTGVCRKCGVDPIDLKGQDETTGQNAVVAM